MGHHFMGHHFCVIVVLPELDDEGWTSDDFVRDMPVDYTLLVENLLDPGMPSCARITAETIAPHCASSLTMQA